MDRAAAGGETEMKKTGPGGLMIVIGGGKAGGKKPEPPPYFGDRGKSESPESEPPEREPAGKTSPEEAGLHRASHVCGNCKHYDGGACAVVDATGLEPEDWCNLFEEYEDEATEKSEEPAEMAA